MHGDIIPNDRLADPNRADEVPRTPYALGAPVHLLKKTELLLHLTARVYLDSVYDLAHRVLWRDHRVNHHVQVHTVAIDADLDELNIGAVFAERLKRRTKPLAPRPSSGSSAGIS